MSITLSDKGNPLFQAAWSEVQMEAAAKKLHELAEKHNVKLSMPIHDVLHVDGNGTDIADFMEAYTKWVLELEPPTTPIPLEVNILKKER